MSLDKDTEIAEKASKSTFKFGNGSPVQSIKKVSLPVMIGKQEIDLETDVVAFKDCYEEIVYCY